MSQPTVSSPSPTLTARQLLRRCDRAVLATSLATTDEAWPYASLVLIAADLDASPLLLISRLAEHTKNILRDAHASLLFDGTAGLSDPLTGARVTVLGELAPDPAPAKLARYTRRHPSAAAYAGFADFALYRMAVKRAHLVAGFGRIHWVEGEELLDRAPVNDALRAAEPGILQHMNHDHADALDLYAQRLLGVSGNGWQLTGVDREGADLRHGGEVARIPFPTPLADVSDIREVFAALAQSAQRSVQSH
jgi:heme oxygenase (biliverdin-IX-beta and delta-forming)